MSSKAHQTKEQARSERWVDGLLELARRRGDTDGVGQRAVALSRQLNVSPWIALGVAERLITMAQARELNRAGRCKELQAAILDKRRTVEELRFLMPYAAHFLASDLLETRRNDGWNDRVVIRILEAILGGEKKLGDDEMSFRVRTRSLEDYAAMVERVLAIMKRARCDVGMALDVEAGRMTEQFASDFTRQKRMLEMEERRMKESVQDESPRFPARRQGRGEGARRSGFQRLMQAPVPREHRSGSEGQGAGGFPRDHWPK